MSEATGSKLLEGMKAAVGSAAELKLELINTRSKVPGRMVFVFEGDDDRGVYFSWVRFVDSTLKYEPFTCKGKSAVLKLKGAVDRDAGDLANGVYFFIDRDFDDSRGVVLDDRIYMTDAYSIENYLVNREVLEEILKIELNCHGRPDVRANLAAAFERVYDQFLLISEKYNLLIYCARKTRMELDQIPASLMKYMVVERNEVSRSQRDDADFLPSTSGLSEKDVEAFREEFNRLDRRTRYRGKFAFSFFIHWLGVLAADRRNTESDLFGGMDVEARTRVDRLSITTVASRSTPPESFCKFLSDSVIKSAGKPIVPEMA